VITTVTKMWNISMFWEELTVTTAVTMGLGYFYVPRKAASDYGKNSIFEKS
jgi:hypothetical protein